MPTTTRLLIKQDILDWWNAHFDEVLRRFAMPLTTTTTSSNQTTALDTDLAGGTTAANDYDAREIEIAEKVASGPEIGERAIVDDGGFDNASRLTFSPALTAALQGGTDYFLYGHGLSVGVLNAGINTVLRSTEGPHIWFPSLVEDADLSGATITDFWTDSGTPTTTEYDTTAANMLFGTQALHVLVDGVDEGLRSNDIPVTERENLLLSCLVKCVTSDMRVTLYDSTNNAVIRFVTVDEPAWTEVRFTEPVPANCEKVSILVTGATNNSEFYVSGPVLLQSQWGRSYVTPSWFTRREQVLEALEFPLGFISEDTHSYAALSQRAIAHPTSTFLRDDRSLNPLMLEFKAYTRPVGFGVYRTFDELSTNAGTTPCDREYVMWKMLANILLARGEDAQAFTARRRATAAAASLRYGLHEKRMVENAQVVV